MDFQEKLELLVTACGGFEITRDETTFTMENKELNIRVNGNHLKGIVDRIYEQSGAIYLKKMVIERFDTKDFKEKIKHHK